MFSRLSVNEEENVVVEPEKQDTMTIDVLDDLLSQYVDNGECNLHNFAIKCLKF